MLVEAIEQAQATAPVTLRWAGCVGAAASWGMGGVMIWLQRERIRAGVEVKFSRTLLLVVNMLMLTGLASLALLPDQWPAFMTFVGVELACVRAIARPPSPPATGATP